MKLVVRSFAEDSSVDIYLNSVQCSISVNVARFVNSEQTRFSYEAHLQKTIVSLFSSIQSKFGSKHWVWHDNIIKNNNVIIIRNIIFYWFRFVNICIILYW